MTEKGIRWLTFLKMERDSIQPQKSPVSEQKGPGMISNERPSPYGNRAHQAGARPQKPHVNEDLIRSEKVQIERKTFVFSLKENPRGRFLRITEDVGGRRDTIIVPSTGLEEFSRVLHEMVQTSDQTPPAETDQS